MTPFDVFLRYYPEPSTPRSKISSFKLKLQAITASTCPKAPPQSLHSLFGAALRPSAQTRVKQSSQAELSEPSNTAAAIFQFWSFLASVLSLVLVSFWPASESKIG
jgi:hypothetical protein